MRMLVLFLLGLLIVVPSFLPLATPLPAQPVCVATDTAGDWRLWSGPAMRAGEEEKSCAPSGPERQGYALFAAPAGTTLPPVLAFFADRPLPINHAETRTLTLLPGIGPRLAEAISSNRQRLGPFAGPDDLRRVPGIGPATVRRLLPMISFE